MSGLADGAAQHEMDSGTIALSKRLSPLQAYRARVETGALRPDAAQEEAVKRLDALAAEIRDWNPNAWFGRKSAPRGLYLWGPVGRGKSLLMDLFFAALSETKKRRTHFHEFMLEQHAFMHAERANGAVQDELIARAAKKVASEARILCFDEVQVTDIADAMILGRLFERLFAQDVIIVATSNRPPDDLYKNGLNRQLFVPFIELLKQKLATVEVAGPEDFRLAGLMAAPVYHYPLGPAADEAMDAAWARLTSGGETHPVTLEVQGRKLHVERHAAEVARLAFSELCERPLGSADYIELAERFHTILLENVPKFTPAMREEAARFRNLIDALYEAKTKLVCSAEAEPQNLYPEGDQSFEFERTASRLMEMRSQAYLALPRRDAEWKRGIVE